jgi:peptidoglycan/LPS O-acetylase OafA/YrhL
MPALVEKFIYRPEVDGLRAVAILAVLFYHAGFSFSGGYIGVDIFFVISGFLITSLIINEFDRQQFTLFKFWERRILRIFPALFLVLLVTLIIGWFLLLPDDYIELGKSTAYQSVFAANIHFWVGLKLN